MQLFKNRPLLAKFLAALAGALVGLLLILMATGCEEKSLQKAAIYGQAATEELAEIQALTIELNRAGTLDDRNTATMMRIVLTANAALQTGKNTVARIQARVDGGSEFTTQDRAALQGLFTDFARAITELNDAGVTRIKNPDAVIRWNVLIGSVVQTTNLLVALW